MGIILTVVLILFLVAQLASIAFIRIEDGSPAKDKDILELFEKKGNLYDRIHNNWDRNLIIQSKFSEAPTITRNNKWFIYYPYTIDGVGAVPRWYKSRKVIDAKFAELFKGSQYDTNKRKKLGLE
jgi:hypothetical protein